MTDELLELALIFSWSIAGRCRALDTRLKTVQTLILAARMEEADRAITLVNRALTERWERNDLIAALTARFEDLRDGRTQ